MFMHLNDFTIYYCFKVTISVGIGLINFSRSSQIILFEPLIFTISTSGLICFYLKNKQNKQGSQAEAEWFVTIYLKGNNETKGNKLEEAFVLANDFSHVDTTYSGKY